MRITVAGLLAAALSFALSVALLTALSVLSVTAADTPTQPHHPCVTAAEDRAVQVGTPARRATRILDGYGRASASSVSHSGQTGQGRVYRYCAGGEATIVVGGTPAIVTAKRPAPAAG